MKTLKILDKYIISDLAKIILSYLEPKNKTFLDYCQSGYYEKIIEFLDYKNVILVNKYCNIDLVKLLLSHNLIRWIKMLKNRKKYGHIVKQILQSEMSQWEHISQKHLSFVYNNYYKQILLYFYDYDHISLIRLFISYKFNNWNKLLPDICHQANRGIIKQIISEGSVSFL